MSILIAECKTGACVSIPNALEIPQSLKPSVLIINMGRVNIFKFHRFIPNFPAELSSPTIYITALDIGYDDISGLAQDYGISIASA